MARVTIVTDASADIPPGIADELGIVVAPLRYELGSRHLVSGELSPEEFYRELEAGTRVQVEGVAADDFERAFREAAERNPDIVCVCQSVGSSFTRVSAEVAIRRVEADGTAKVRLLTPGKADAALGALAISGALAADEGLDLKSVFEAIEQQSTMADMYVIPASLEQLERAGQLPMLSMQSKVGPLDEGVPVFRLRGSPAAVEREDDGEAAEDAMLTRIHTDVAGRTIVLGIVHAMAEEAAEKLAAKAEQNMQVSRMFIAPMGPAAGALFGRGAYGIGFCVSDIR